MSRGRSRVSRLGAIVGLAAVVVVLGALGAALQARDTHASANEAKIAGGVFDATANGNETSFIVYLSDQADLSKAAAIKNEDERGWYVYDKLTQEAARTQAPIKAALDAEGVSYKSYWAANMIVAEGDRGLVEDLADRDDVKAIEPNAWSTG